MRQLPSKEALAKMHFLISIADLFNLFLVDFQKEEPLIHVLYDQFISISKRLIGRFIKNEALKDQRGCDLSKLNLEYGENQLSDNSLEIGEETKKVLKSLPTEKKRVFILGVWSFFKAAGKHLLKRLPLDNVILSKCKVLSPLARSKDWSSKAIKDMATKLHVDVNITTLCDEWRLYQLDQIPEDWLTTDDQSKKPVRVDVYWNKVGEMKNDFGDLNLDDLLMQIMLRERQERKESCLIRGREERTGKRAKEQEASAKLQEALKNKDFKKAAVAQAMLDSGRKKIDDANKLIQSTREKQKTVLKRKYGLLKKLLPSSTSQSKNENSDVLN
ncbi:hypothetical protein AC249_AIPGENE22736 [Exaiptasia diaphana]|nr:hypothetical protein AC249_AIPGENE22736 [Exaiptasia diaphana]